MPIPSGSVDQGTLPLIGLDDELSALREEVSRLRAENARLLRLLELTPQQARPPGPVQSTCWGARMGLWLSGFSSWRLNSPSRP